MLQYFLVVVMILLAFALNYYFFKPVNWLLWLMGPALLAVVIFIWTNKHLSKGARIIGVSAAASLLFNFLLNYNFFPQLLKYQAGNEMVKIMREKDINIAEKDIIVVEPNAHSFDFYRGHNHLQLPAEEFEQNYPQLKDKYFLVTRAHRDTLLQRGYQVEPIVSHVDYNVAKVSLKFLRPETRAARLDTLMLVKIHQNN